MAAWSSFDFLLAGSASWALLPAAALAPALAGSEGHASLLLPSAAAAEEELVSTPYDLVAGVVCLDAAAGPDVKQMSGLIGLTAVTWMSKLKPWEDVLRLVNVDGVTLEPGSDGLATLPWDEVGSAASLP